MFGRMDETLSVRTLWRSAILASLLIVASTVASCFAARALIVAAIRDLPPPDPSLFPVPPAAGQAATSAGGPAPRGPVELTPDLRAQVTPEVEAYVQALARELGIELSGSVLEVLEQTVRGGNLLAEADVRKILATQAPERLAEGDGTYVRNALTLHLLAMAAGEGTPPPPGGRPGTATPGEPPGAPGANAVVQMDQLLATRLAEVVSGKGGSLEEYLPPQRLRDQATATGSLDAPETRALLDAYRDAFGRLGAVAP